MDILYNENTRRTLTFLYLFHLGMYVCMCIRKLHLNFSTGFDQRPLIRVLSSPEAMNTAPTMIAVGPTTIAPYSYFHRLSL